jgi:tungstate transport system ATP-binding protein
MIRTGLTGWSLQRMTLYQLNDIELRRGAFSLRVDSLVLEADHLYTLHGENGSGKSTLLKLLALLMPPRQGCMIFAGHPVIWQPRLLHRLRREITLLEQNPLLLFGTVEENLAFGLKLRGLRGAKLQQRIDQALDTTGLQGFNHRLARELSGGETRRVALARALALQPSLLLLDEPTANVDAGQIEALERFLVTLPEQGMCVVVATHDAAQPLRLGGRQIHLRGGCLQQPAWQTRPVDQACCSNA